MEKSVLMKKSIKEININKVIFTTAGDYQGEELPDILKGKYADLQKLYEYALWGFSSGKPLDIDVVRRACKSEADCGRNVYVIMKYTSSKGASNETPNAEFLYFSPLDFESLNKDVRTKLCPATDGEADSAGKYPIPEDMKVTAIDRRSKGKCCAYVFDDIFEIEEHFSLVTLFQSYSRLLKGYEIEAVDSLLSKRDYGSYIQYSEGLNSSEPGIIALKEGCLPKIEENDKSRKNTYYALKLAEPYIVELSNE